MTPKAEAEKMFSESTVAILLMTMGNSTISMAQYDMMSALDGVKTASSFQHQFRSVLQKVRDLKRRVDDGETFAPIQASKKRAGDKATPPTTPKKAKITLKTTPKSTPTGTPKSRAKKVEKVEIKTNNNGSDADDEYVKADSPSYIKTGCDLGNDEEI